MSASAATNPATHTQLPLHKQHKQKGYSIVELSIALAIISIILVTALAGVQRILRSNNTNEDLRNLNLLASKLTVMLSNVATKAGVTQAILDLGSANEQIIRYFSRSLSEAVFREQESKFVSNTLNNNFIQIYFEEAHMIFPPNAGNTIDVYSRFAKEGAKFNIGIVYSTQSPSTVNRDLLSQTENFFIGHLSSSIDTEQLAKIQHAFGQIGDIIMRQRTRGLLHVLTHSHRYVIPVQANRYNGSSRLVP